VVAVYRTPLPSRKQSDTAEEGPMQSLLRNIGFSLRIVGKKRGPTPALSSLALGAAFVTTLTLASNDLPGKVD
jgi:hypothetical protein